MNRVTINMKSFKVLAVVVLLIICTTSCPAIASDCGGVRETDEACRISFAELVRDQRYNGRHVILSGYVKYKHGRYYLFPSPELYHYSGGTGGLALRMGDENFRAMGRAVEHEFPIEVSGFFNAMPVDHIGGLGSLDMKNFPIFQSKLMGRPPVQVK